MLGRYLDPSQVEEIHYRFLNLYRRPTKRTWERFDGQEWKGAGVIDVESDIERLALAVTGGKYLPPGVYRRLYSQFATMAWLPLRDDALFNIENRRRWREQGQDT